jgi:hypothetical protein
MLRVGGSVAFFGDRQLSRFDGLKRQRAFADECFCRCTRFELTSALATRRSCRSGAPGAVPDDRDCARGAHGRRRSLGCLCPEAALPSQPKAPARLPLVRETRSGGGTTPLCAEPGFARRGCAIARVGRVPLSPQRGHRDLLIEVASRDLAAPGARDDCPAASRSGVPEVHELPDRLVAVLLE